MQIISRSIFWNFGISTLQQSRYENIFVIDILPLQFYISDQKCDASSLEIGELCVPMPSYVKNEKICRDSKCYCAPGYKSINCTEIC